MSDNWQTRKPSKAAGRRGRWIRGEVVSRLSRPYSRPYAPATNGAPVAMAAVRAKNCRRAGDSMAPPPNRDLSLRTAAAIPFGTASSSTTRNATSELAIHHASGADNSASGGVSVTGVERPPIRPV
jgi:hypothetical protein